MTKAFPSSVCAPTLTHHACSRGRERFSLSKHSLARLAERALQSGIQRQQTRGSLRSYLDTLWTQYYRADNMRVYGEYLFLFSGTILITVWHLPAIYRRHAARLSKQSI